MPFFRPLLACVLVTLGVSALGAQQTPNAKPAPTVPAKPALELSPPRDMGSVLFAIIGDSGTGDRSQYEVGAQMTKARQIFPFDFVIMLGDNIYGSERPQDFVKKFERPYDGILSQKIPFYASLGNHDDPTQRYYKPFNMNGERFYSFKKGDARFFALDSNYMDQPQLKWLEEQLSGSNDRWKIAFFHHPLYSSGARHGSEIDLRTRLEPLFIKYGVDVVFAGHEHFYERIVPQKGIYYFTQGGSAKLRKGNIRRGPLTASGYDTDNVFMVAELGKDSMRFQVLSRNGRRVDSGSLPLMPEPKGGSQ
jgi:3',5'-cyclic AMP phosphodiesterase CpdA